MLRLSRLIWKRRSRSRGRIEEVEHKKIEGLEIEVDFLNLGANNNKFEIRIIISFFNDVNKTSLEVLDQDMRDHKSRDQDMKRELMSTRMVTRTLNPML